jgi:hypothetical protein
MQGDSSLGASPAAAWALEAMPWLLAALLVAVAIGAVGVWVLVARLRELERVVPRLDALEELRAGVARLVADRGDLDLRRLEHVLIEMRDGGRRLEDALLRAVQREPRAQASAGAPSEVELSERVIQRLLALGYEEIRLVTRADELSEIAVAGGEVLVEARRHGAICKGRVRLRGGVLVDVDLQPAWSTFP